MKERVVSFGAGGNLIGVLAEPNPEALVPNAPAALLWNVGIHHRVGPYRIFVDLARELASAGFSSLRFDVSGLGDSEVSRNDTRSERERGMADIRSAMQLLRERTGRQSFVLIAFCSGVDAAHAIGLSDENVVGGVYLEGYRFRTPGFYFRYPLRFLDRDRWERWLRTHGPKYFPKAFAGKPELPEAEQVFVRELPTPDKLRADFARMVARGMKLLLVYFGVDGNYTYRDQLYEMLKQPRAKSAVDVRYYANADHILSLQEDRDRTVRDVVFWMEKTFGKAAQESGRERSEMPGSRESLEAG